MKPRPLYFPTTNQRSPPCNHAHLTTPTPWPATLLHEAPPPFSPTHHSALPFMKPRPFQSHPPISSALHEAPPPFSHTNQSALPFMKPRPFQSHPPISAPLHEAPPPFSHTNQSALPFMKPRPLHVTPTNQHCTLKPRPLPLTPTNERPPPSCSHAPFVAAFPAVYWHSSMMGLGGGGGNGVTMGGNGGHLWGAAGVMGRYGAE